jgi:hypothetical protein
MSLKEKQYYKQNATPTNVHRRKTVLQTKCHSNKCPKKKKNSTNATLTNVLRR